MTEREKERERERVGERVGQSYERWKEMESQSDMQIGSRRS